MTAILTPGTLAPDFTPPVAPDKQLTLSGLRGKPVILAFYPADWSRVCGDQMALYNEVLPEFKSFGAELVGISVDGAWCHAAFAKDHHLHFPLAADFEPKGAVSRAYGAYREKEGFSERALFVLDKDGVITWSYLSPISVNPGAEADFRSGVRSGVNGTPTFFINGQRHDGAYDYAPLVEAIEGVLV